ncbi:MAG: threonine transporter RhtB [Rhodobacteraceae bacterium]|nr:threonine transporter RhtB [Paracoccaceae bacterium]MBT26656.1 threonine transporter RhtB [Paracoccaceae bacterium]
MDLLALLAFIPAGLALNLTPGADMMFCLGQGLRSGPGPAIAASGGIAMGGFVHALAAGLGLSTLVSALPGAFDIIRWIGVGYLLWLAWHTVRAGPTREAVQGVSARRAFGQGFVVNLTNPKVILFVLAFVPQFVDPARPVLPQFLIYGAVLSLGGFIINGLVGIFAGGIGRKLTADARFATWLGRISAGIFVALAARLALMQKG